MLHEFLTANTPEILARTRAKVAARTRPLPTDDQLKNGVRVFLGQLIDRLRLATVDSGAIEESAAIHGGELLAMGFTVGQVIHGYGDVCQVITQLADELHESILTDEFQLFHRCLDDAMAHSVTEYQRRRDESVAGAGTARLGVLANGLRDRLADAEGASKLLRKGSAAIGGSTGAVLGRSLRGMGTLVTTALAGAPRGAEIEPRPGSIEPARAVAAEPSPEPGEGGAAADSR
jgi:hypothetical protein